MRRLIPAHAGKTLRGRGRRRWRRAHPRSRGENAACEGGVSAGSGSSPLTRGKRFCELRVSFDAGLIPAHAGKTTAGAGKLTTEKAHPRSRGENGHTKGTLKCTSGSSPLTRGKPRVGGRRRARVRLIPAHAGKTLVVNVGDVGQQAHPRSRGENRVPAPRINAPLGSSPLTRGKRTLRVTAGILRRLIPAHAGKTESLCFRSFFLSAHPRSRGENGYPVSVQAQLLGSSPLTRGKRRVAPGVAQDRGLIPAHAGKTKAAQQMVVNFQAHPRSRGENDSHAPSSHEDSGSSPLTRGKRKLLSSRSSHPRLIPAHAGKT